MLSKTSGKVKIEIFISFSFPVRLVFSVSNSFRQLMEFEFIFLGRFWE